ncbi:NAD(P)-dependent alcohol dehydrogenase [Sphingobium sp.]|uniref:NAD(P)-dependent alcohol dehydrogenase n=1 Tax=Sphingobium sp. TaxID=1912891 RepID=UPI0028BE6255|nr:NAD(P)-dependent alcohol dehydrogenase [Sphingobium sp.]
MKIEAAVTTGAGQPFSIRPLELDPPREDEILVRLVGVGICHTDLFFRETNVVPFPAVLGHEGAGFVEKVGSAVSKVSPGDRVALTFRSCGRCARCTGGNPAYCDTMAQLNYVGRRPDGSCAIRSDDGPVGSNFFGQSSFATYALAYESNVVKVPDDVDLRLMGPLGCGVQTGAGAVMRSLDCKAGSSILIVGGGPVGLSAVMAARIVGCRRIILVEPVAARRELGLSLGATDVIAPDPSTKLGRAIREIEDGGVDYALDTTGHPDVQRSVLAALANRAVYGIVGVPPLGTSPPGDLIDVINRGLTIRGILEGDSDPDTFIPFLIDLYKRGQLPFDRLIRIFPFAQINQAIAAQSGGECVKVVLSFEELPAYRESGSPAN